jgi:hypothetical protein
MFNKFKRFGMAAAALLVTAPLLADQALKVEEILSKKNSLKADLSFAYSNIDQSTGTTSVVPVRTLYSYVYVPVYAGDRVIDQDLLFYSLNVKYGVMDGLELVAFADAHSATSRMQYGSQLTSSSESDFDRAGIGLTYKIKDEGAAPSLLVGATANVVSRVQYASIEDGNVTGTDKRDENFDSYNIHLLSYYTVDPLVFVLKASYQWSLEKSYEQSTIDNGDLLTVSPEVFFAVNPYTNLYWGINFQYKLEDKRNGEEVTNAESILGFSFGLSYEVVRNSILSVDYTRNDASTYQQSTFGLTFSQRF